ncbi:MAG: hypothetical protein ACOCQD_03920 [archaeon]
MKYKIGQKVEVDIDKIYNAINEHRIFKNKIISLYIEGNNNTTKIYKINANEKLPYRVNPPMVCDYYDENGNINSAKSVRLHDYYIVKSVPDILIDDKLFEL